jgi:dipeptidyl aminopeptidase/acylaminoacyl peptidase
MESPQSKPRRLTEFNADFDLLSMGKSEVVTWRSPDKAPKDWIENGILTFPPDYIPGKKLPLVLYIHGGPTSVSKDTFSVWAQLLAAQEWLVFEPNYRGSDNKGSDFKHAIFADAGEGPGRDVLAAWRC